MAYYRNIDRYSDQHGHIVNFDETETVYNVYGCFIKNDEYDPEDEDSSEFIPVGFDDCYCDENGRFLNSQVFSHGVSQVWMGSEQTIYEDADGKVEFSPATSGAGIVFFSHWDGHNFVAIILDTDEGESEWELVGDDEFNADALITVEEGEWNHGRKEMILLDAAHNCFYKKHLSRWQGSLDSYEKFDDEYEIIPALREYDPVMVNNADYDDEDKQQEVAIVAIGEKWIVYDYCLGDNGNNEYHIEGSEEAAVATFNRLNSNYQTEPAA